MNSVIGFYRLVKEAGEGSSGIVFDAIQMSTGKRAAVKQVPKTHPTIKREIELMKLINHPNIVAMYDVMETDTDYYIAMEFVEGVTLLEYIKNYQGYFNDYLIRHILVQLLSVLSYLHCTLKIIHRDFKLENIIIDNFQNIKLIDFGLSNIAKGENNVCNTACGSPTYLAPELIQGKEYTYKVDIWALGIITYAMLFKMLPFTDENMGNLFKKIIYTEPVFYPNGSQQAKNFILKCLVKDPSQRASLEELTEDPWISTFSNTVGPFPKCFRKTFCTSSMRKSEGVLPHRVIPFKKTSITPHVMPQPVIKKSSNSIVRPIQRKTPQTIPLTQKKSHSSISFHPKLEIANEKDIIA